MRWAVTVVIVFSFALAGCGASGTISGTATLPPAPAMSIGQPTIVAMPEGTTSRTLRTIPEMTPRGKGLDMPLPGDLGCSGS